MSVAVSGVVWKSGPYERNQRFVLLAIADNASDEGYAFPLVSTIADKCVMTPRNVLRILKILADDGWISISVSPKNHKANAYQINLAKVSGDKMSRDKLGSSQVTNSTFSGDKPGITILSNVINRQSNVRQAKPATSQIELPKWLDQEIWEGHLEVRTARRAPKTPRAFAGIIKRLEAFRVESFDPNKILENSNLSGWVNVYKPRFGDDAQAEVKPLTIAEKMRRDGF